MDEQAKLVIKTVNGHLNVCLDDGRILAGVTGIDISTRANGLVSTTIRLLDVKIDIDGVTICGGSEQPPPEIGEALQAMIRQVVEQDKKKHG